MKIGLLRKINKHSNEHNRYRHLIFYKVNEDRTLNIKLAIPLLIV